MNTEDKKVSLEIPLNTQMKIFAFLFQSEEDYSISELFSGTPEVGYYGESRSFSIDTQTNNLSLGITLIHVSGTGTDTGGGSDTGGGTETADTAAPIIEQVTAIESQTSDSTPEYTFRSTKTGSITYGDSCDSATIIAYIGNNTIVFNALSDGYYYDCIIKIIDSEGNESNTITIPPFTVDTTVNDTMPPVIEESSGITTPTTDTTPDYTFSSSEAGNITYGGTCETAGSATTAIVGHNLITYNTLSDGSYIDCTITVTDSAGNVSNPLSVTPFTVNTTVTNDTIDTTLLAHYAFEGNLFDNSSYNRDLTEDNVSNITYSAADNTSNKSGRAALFNGTNTYAYTDNITLSDNFTVAFWTIPFSSSMSPWDSALSSGDSTSSGIFQIDFNDNNTRFCAGICYISTTLDSNEWNHIVITKSDNSTDNKKIRLYKNGVLKTYTYPIITLWDKIKVGLNRTGGGYWNGYIDELKIYNRTFSTQEVRDLHDSY
ncbi:MAG: LamG domain-containing protein [Deltaproteobacteria bacterium]|nr:LamG domain-containing protein [Deltaproteobacteria bacterium]